MHPNIDLTNTTPTPESRALLHSLDDTTFHSLGVLFGSDLCVLGATSHPTCWQPLKTAWHQLNQREQEHRTVISTQALSDRDLLIPRPSARASPPSSPRPATSWPASSASCSPPASPRPS
jgi:hypothetical protein